jgi:aminopeptidase YwaD
MRTPTKLLAILLLFVSTSRAQAPRTPEITGPELIEHIKYLASDKLEGRKTGSPGAELAAEYIEKEFSLYGLRPMGDHGTFFQNFDFVSGVRLGKNNHFSVRTDERSSETSLVLDQDYRPLGFSASGSYTGAVIFAGYGITATDKNYDDYAGVDAKGKAVILLRYTPDGDTPHGDFSAFSPLRLKISRAQEIGAKLVIVVTGPSDSDKDDLMKLDYDRSFGSASIQVINMKRNKLDRLVKNIGHTILDLQQTINEKKKPASFLVDRLTISVNVDLDEIHQTGKNLVAYLEGSDTALRSQILIIGAHYDHLGYGGEGSGSLKPDTVAIHHGADDNASGTAGLLELAQWFASKKTELKRSILFISFSGEELGLLGSAYYVKNPVFPLDHSIAMLNMDEIGRLRDRKLIVFGMGTSPGFEALVSRLNSDSVFVLKLNKDGFGPSDHASFYAKQIPVMHFFTDIHSDYHKPSDEYTRINVDGTEKVTRFVGKVAMELDQLPERPKYVQTEAPRSPSESRGFRVYVGTIPDYSEQVEGMKISGVRDGSPAAKGGLQGGDIIIKFGKIDVKNIYDYTFALGEYKPGDEVDVTIKRGSETKTLHVKLERRN